jgi:uncharacterized protein YneR
MKLGLSLFAMLAMCGTVPVVPPIGERTGTTQGPPASPIEQLQRTKTADESAVQSLFSDPLKSIPVDGNFYGDPSQLLGQVLQVTRPSSAVNCPGKDLVPDPIAEPVFGFPINANNQEDKVREVLVQSEIAAKVNFLGIVSGEGSDKDVFSIVVTHHYANVKNEKGWIDALTFFAQNQGKKYFDNDQVCWLLVVTAAMELQADYTKYHDYDGQVVAGAYGVNIGGKMYSGDHQFIRARKFWMLPKAIKNPPANKVEGSFWRPGVRIALADEGTTTAAEKMPKIERVDASKLKTAEEKESTVKMILETYDRRVKKGSEAAVKKQYEKEHVKWEHLVEGDSYDYFKQVAAEKNANKDR